MTEKEKHEYLRCLMGIRNRGYFVHAKQQRRKMANNVIHDHAQAHH